MLNTSCLPERTRALFDLLSTRAELSGFFLIGGTALALQENHRISEDLDFSLTGGEKLPRPLLNSLMMDLKEGGHQVHSLTKPSQISQARIMGVNLLDYAQDYAIDGVKATFFVDNRYTDRQALFRSFPRLKEEGLTFDVASLDGLFAMKSLVVTNRRKSRDLFDLYYLLSSKGYAFDEMLNLIERYSPETSQPELFMWLSGKGVMDRDDPGVEPTDKSITMNKAFQFFKHEIDKYEVEQSRLIASSFTPPRPPSKSGPSR